MRTSYTKGQACDVIKPCIGTTKEDQESDCKMLGEEFEVVESAKMKVSASYDIMVKMYPTHVRCDVAYQKRVDWRRNGPQPRRSAGQ